MAPANFQIVAPSEPVYRGSTPTFTTTNVTDPDGDSVTVEWAVMKVCAPGVPFATDCSLCDAGSYMNESNWPSEELRKPALRYDVAPSFTEQPFCVWAFAVDSKGAARPAMPRLVTPVNRTPVAKITVIPHVPPTLVNTPGVYSQPYPLFSMLELSSAASKDDDPADSNALQSEWTVLNPRGVAVPLDECVFDNSSPAPCFAADDPGTYRVTLKISDGHDGSDTTMMHGGSDTTMMLIGVAPDRLPCMVDTALSPRIFFAQGAVVPLPADSDQRVELQVNSVEDDGDFVPRTPASPYADFRWSKGKVGENLTYVGGNYRNYAVPIEYTLGDLVKVRVEFLDRNRAAVESALAACGDADLCGPPGCRQRVTWTIQY